MPIADVWKKDKAKSLTSFEDLALIYFDKSNYVDNAQTILASFENFVTDDLDSSGNVLPITFDSETALSIDNYESLFYYDENESNRVMFHVNSDDFNEGINGNVPRVGEIIQLNGTILAGTFRVWKSDPIVIYFTYEINDQGIWVGTLNQTLGKIWLADELDDSDYGVNWDSDWLVAEGSGIWLATQESWTDSDITINKSVFWTKDASTPEELAAKKGGIQ